MCIVVLLISLYCSLEVTSRVYSGECEEILDLSRMKLTLDVMFDLARGILVNLHYSFILILLYCGYTEHFSLFSQLAHFVANSVADISTRNLQYRAVMGNLYAQRPI